MSQILHLILFCYYNMRTALLAFHRPITDLIARYHKYCDDNPSGCLDALVTKSASTGSVTNTTFAL